MNCFLWGWPSLDEERRKSLFKRGCWCAGWCAGAMRTSADIFDEMQNEFEGASSKRRTRRRRSPAQDDSAPRKRARATDGQEKVGDEEGDEAREREQVAVLMRSLGDEFAEK